jgi:hypothetical protein
LGGRGEPSRWVGLWIRILMVGEVRGFFRMGVVAVVFRGGSGRRGEATGCSERSLSTDHLYGGRVQDGQRAV